VRYLFDTNTISEALKPTPNPSVIKWLDNAPPEATYISVLTLGEVRKGAEKLALGPRRERIRHWLDVELLEQFEGRILPIDLEVADRWGRVVAQQSGKPRPPIDCLLAATALTHGLMLVTRDTDLVGISGLEIFNPWAMN
jgi:toxin FitB